MYGVATLLVSYGMVNLNYLPTEEIYRLSIFTDADGCLSIKQSSYVCFVDELFVAANW